MGVEMSKIRNIEELENFYNSLSTARKVTRDEIRQILDTDNRIENVLYDRKGFNDNYKWDSTMPYKESYEIGYLTAKNNNLDLWTGRRKPVELTNIDNMASDIIDHLYHYKSTKVIW